MSDYIDQRIESLGKGQLVGYFENNSPEWHAARSGIGGSDIGTILGVNRYKSRQELLEDKINKTPPIEPTLPMRMGTIFENGIRLLWWQNNNDWLNIHQTGSWKSAINPFWTANPDGIIEWMNGTLGILEIKYSQASKPPESWFMQVQWYLMLTGLNKGIIVQCSGNKLLEHQVIADPVLQIEMQTAALNFEEEMRKYNGIQLG